VQRAQRCDDAARVARAPPRGVERIRRVDERPAAAVLVRVLVILVRVLVITVTVLALVVTVLITAVKGNW
jgi:hypothetical protein